jgi:uncharacterized protein
MPELLTTALGPREAALWERVRPLLPRYELAHDPSHVARVTQWCIRLAPELGAEPAMAAAAGIVHDLVHVPKDSPRRSAASLLSAAAAREPLEACGYSEAERLLIIEAVRTCSWSAGLPPDNPLGMILQDADRLDALGVIGAFRNIAVAQDMTTRTLHGAFWHPTDPFLETDRAPDDSRWALDHWRIKLLTLASGMHTEGARREAARRTAHMLQLLDLLGAELQAGSRTEA